MKEASLRTRLSNSHGCRNLFWRIGELTVHGTFYSNTSTGLKHYIFDHVVSSFVNNIFLKAVYIREEFNSPRTASDIDMAVAILLCQNQYGRRDVMCENDFSNLRVPKRPKHSDSA